jgi:UDPglucose 6-dehydrogenase
LWIAYDTPVDENDTANVEQVLAEVTKTIPYISNEVTILISSQLPVGSVARLESIVRNLRPQSSIGIACCPENLRLGNALGTFLQPDRMIAGVRSKRDRERIARLFQPITDRIEWMSVESAEMTKHALNAFLATSVAFANEVATLCEAVGADAKDVERGLKSDGRIGQRAYLSPGSAFAGGTLARDVAYLNGISADRQISTPILSAIKSSNEGHKLWVQRKLLSIFPTLENICVAVWGLTYKPNTSTLRRSMAVELCNWLIERGVSVTVHDPEVKTLPVEWKGKVHYASNALDALESAQVLVVSTEWGQYRDISIDSIAAASPGIAVLDANRFLKFLPGNRQIQYFSVGMPRQTIGTLCNEY